MQESDPGVTLLAPDCCIFVWRVLYLLPGVLTNFPVNDSRGDCSPCPLRDFRHGQGRSATINYAQF